MLLTYIYWVQIWCPPPWPKGHRREAGLAQECAAALRPLRNVSATA